MSISNDNQQSLEIKLSVQNPSDLTQQVFSMLNRGEITMDGLVNKLSEDQRLASSLIAGTTQLVGDIAEKASSSQKLHAENLAKSLQQTLTLLQQLGNSLESDTAKLRFAEILVELSKQYFLTIKAVSEEANNFWKYTMGGLIALGIAFIGGKEYLHSRNSKDLNG